MKKEVVVMLLQGQTEENHNRLRKEKSRLGFSCAYPKLKEAYSILNHNMQYTNQAPGNR
jgi:hypothetical protein